MNYVYKLLSLLVTTSAISAPLIDPHAYAGDALYITGNVVGQNLSVDVNYLHGSGSLELKMAGRHSHIGVRGYARNSKTTIYQTADNRDLLYIADQNSADKAIFSGSCSTGTRTVVKSSEIRGKTHIARCK